jgi:hypothetical protein
LTIAIRPALEGTYEQANEPAVAGSHYPPLTRALTPLAVMLGLLMWGTLFLVVRHFI